MTRSGSISTAAGKTDASSTTLPFPLRRTQRWALVGRALKELIRYELIANRGIKAVHSRIGATATAATPSADVAPEPICRAVDAACLMYLRHVRCLQRSYALTRLLRQHGYAASFIIGFQPVPLRHHAWVELDGRIVSPKFRGSEHYRVLDRW